MTASPTQLTLRHLREQGWTAEVVEHWIPGANIRRDLRLSVDMWLEMWLDDGMTTTQQLTEAISHRDAARIAYNTAATKKASRDAAEDLEFWVGKVAMLNVMVAS